MPIVVVQTIARVTMKAAAAANTGRQRAAIHNRTGNSSAIGTTVVQGSGGSAMTITLMTIEAADHDGEPAQAHPPPRRIGRVGSQRDELAPFHVGHRDSLPRWRRRSVYRTLNLPPKDGQVLGVNCSQSRLALQPSCPATPKRQHTDGAPEDRCTAGLQFLYVRFGSNRRTKAGSSFAR